MAQINVQQIADQLCTMTKQPLTNSGICCAESQLVPNTAKVTHRYTSISQTMASSCSGRDSVSQQTLGICCFPISCSNFGFDPIRLYLFNFSNQFEQPLQHLSHGGSHV